MAEDGDNGLGEMFADEVSCEAGPSGKVSLVNGFDPRGRNGVAARGMEEGDVFDLRGGMVGAVGKGGGGVSWHLKAMVTHAGVLHAFVDHAAVGFVGVHQR